MNKIEEFSILEKVYSKKEYEIVENEEPDFIVKNINQEIGVEIKNMIYVKRI